MSLAFDPALADDLDPRPFDPSRQESGTTKIVAPIAGRFDFAARGWRVALGWCMPIAVIYTFVIGPLLERPADAFQLVALVGALGVSVLARTAERITGVA